MTYKKQPFQTVIFSCYVKTDVYLFVNDIPVPSRCACTGWLHAMWLMLLYKAAWHVAFIFCGHPSGILNYGCVCISACGYMHGVCRYLWKQGGIWSFRGPLEEQQVLCHCSCPPKCLLSWFWVLSDSMLSLWSPWEKGTHGVAHSPFSLPFSLPLHLYRIGPLPPSALPDLTLPFPGNLCHPTSP